MSESREHKPGRRRSGKALTAVQGRRVTMKELAAHLGVSITTVSRGLKGAADIGPETIEMVRNAAREVGYTPDLRGVKLRTGQSFTICYLKAVLPQQDVPDAAIAAQFDAIAGFLKDTPYQLQIVPWNPAEDDAIEILARIVQGRLADGVLLDLTQPQDRRVMYLLQQDFPFVTFGRTELFTEHPYVDANSERAAYDATAYLLGRGHRRIALMGAQLPFTFNLQRRRGYARALGEAGVAADPDLVREDGVSARVARAAVAGMLAMPDPPTAFVCVNESSALGAMAGIRDCGKAVGVDCDVVARVSTSLNDYLNPPIATCHLDIHGVARQLGEFLLRRIAGEPAQALQRVFDCTFHAPPGARCASHQKP
jgi:LacI family transcriptional regulator